jgi:Ca2+-binding EF-hand superfamily protein
MLTLIQFVNLDGIGAIYTPMVRSEPTTGLFFVSFMLIVSICLMNLVTAVIVEGSFEQAKSDQIFAKKERQRAMSKLLPVVREIFAQLDKDGSGKVTLEEFADADYSVQLALEKVCQTDDLVELFEMLDVDGSGSVEIEEFAEQLANFGTTDQPFINVRLMKQLELARREIKSIYTRVDNVQASVNRQLGSIDSRFEGVEDCLIEIKMMIEGSGSAQGSIPIITRKSPMTTAGATPKPTPFSRNTPKPSPFSDGTKKSPFSQGTKQSTES